ncbi:MAG: DUF3108 domain-containing protein [Mariprofundus sp.]
MVKRKHRLLPAVIICLLLPTAAIAQAESKQACMPYIGEHMGFDVGWEFINAGSATMDIIATDSGWQTKTFAKTNKVLDIFKKVRDYITAEGICINGRMQSTLFDANLRERKYTAKKKTEFLWQQDKVIYTQHKNRESFDVPAGHLSVIDAFLAVRQLPLKAGESYRIPVFDSRERYEIIVDINDKHETVTAPWGEKINCLLVTPKLKTAGIFTDRGEMTLWMSDDERHLPLKIMVKIKIGRIKVRLTEYSQATAVVTAPVSSAEKKQL